ncbi:Hermansky-Pudlak syndrome 1 protein homolog [Sinocyclocheilus grahami]|uniref:Hermansky-Pudlak syndrome 1 protein homolog n=1 Tax=Sinocyclocheilus grahami TaxID=75366 RepID=UPI0007AD69F4|nr:PREDICTED: Hermansky-Pudlak syndrome 1 protein homolog [Sinocyclocheilus grahami]
MKCLLVANESAEVLFYWTDTEFEQWIQEQYGVSQEEGEGLPAFEDSINTLFAPIIISCSTMVDRLGDNYTSFSTANNHIYVLQQTVERLIHPTLCEQCIEFLERRLVQQINSNMDRMGEEVLHAFILVHTKLLTFYSSRNASNLCPSDLLALIILVQDLYPSKINLDDTSEMAEDSLQTLEAPTPDPSAPCRVFLEAKEFPTMPHSMYCLPLWPGITLVLLTKIPNSHVAASVCYFLEAFVKLEKRLCEGHEGAAAMRGQPSVQEQRSRLEKFIKTWASMDIQTSELQNAWTDFKNKAFSRSGSGFTRDLLPSCRNMKTQLCGVYRQFFAAECMGSSQRLAPHLQERALSMVQEKLMDWKDFLLVKSKRNITMVSYLEEFPGLIHFIYVDRSNGQMIAPSLNVTDRTVSELGKGPLADFIKNKIWSLVATAQRYLQKGYATVTLRDGDYFYCYFLWFENETGYKLEVIDIPSSPDDAAPVGMLTCDYYRRLLRYYSKKYQNEVVKCYELFTVHLGVIPNEYILQHCSQLARKLWEPTRIPLL